MPNELAFGDWVFPSMMEAKRACEARFRKYQHGEFIGGEDRRFFLTLFEERYPDFCEAFYGVDDPDLTEKPSLKVVQWNKLSPKFDTPRTGIMAVREDGSWSPVSWRLAVDCVSHDSWVIAAARRVVVPQWNTHLADHKARVGNASMMSGQTEDELVVGYRETSFYGLFRDWRDQADLQSKDILLERSGRTSIRFANEDFAAAWAEYHRRHAKMTVITQLEYRTTKPCAECL